MKRLVGQRGFTPPAEKRPGAAEAVPSAGSLAGFTVVELVVITFVMSIFLLLVMDFAVDKMVQSARDQARSDIQLQAQLALDSIGTELKEGSQVLLTNTIADPDLPTPPGPLGWTSNHSQFVYQRPVDNGPPDYNFVNDPSGNPYQNEFVIYVDAGVLTQRTLAHPLAAPNSESDSYASLIQNVTAFSVRYFDSTGTEIISSLNFPDAHAVEISLNITREVFGDNIEGGHTTRTVMRNR